MKGKREMENKELFGLCLEEKAAKLYEGKEKYVVSAKSNGFLKNAIPKFIKNKGSILNLCEEAVEFTLHGEDGFVFFECNFWDKQEIIGLGLTNKTVTSNVPLEVLDGGTYLMIEATLNNTQEKVQIGLIFIDNNVIDENALDMETIPVENELFIPKHKLGLVH
jgi:hypothetical protein